MSVVFQGSVLDVDVTFTSLYDIFIKQVSVHPQKIAVVLDNQFITYAELSSLVTSFASQLSPLVDSDDIVCQCVERSIEMVIGILAIFMCGNVYCPLSPYDPEERHRMLVKETQAKIILVHKATGHLFNNDNCLIKLRIDQQQVDNYLYTNKIEHTSSIAFVVFTSGSTGIPKGVPIGHKNFLYYITGMNYERYLLESDIILQISRDTFDAHLEEILGAVLLGGTCVLLRPDKGANLNIIYLKNEIQRHQVTFINLVPSLAVVLVDHMSNPKQLLSSSLRVVISTGEPLSRFLAGELLSCIEPHTQLLNTYGVTETTVDCTYRQVLLSDVTSSQSTPYIPIGLPLPNYICHMIIEEDKKENSIGELYIGGPGVFQGYLNRGSNPVDSRLIEINGEMYYQTGDLFQILDGELVYKGRRDFQVKIRGQRIETGEIEAFILRECQEQLNGCIVIARDECLIAYVQIRKATMDIEQQVMQICQQCLPSSMIPSTVVTLDRFPLNANGKVDRARLPLPLSFPTNLSINGTPRNDLESELQILWCQLLKMSNVPCNINLFTLGANSLLFMLAANYYNRRCKSHHTQLDLPSLFRQATIIEHAKLLIGAEQTSAVKSSLITEHLTEGPISFAQESIWLDDQIRFQSEDKTSAVYHIVLAFHLELSNDEQHLFISHLRSSLRLVIEKHASLRMCLYDDEKKGLQQRIISSKLIDIPIHESLIKNNDELFDIINDEETNRLHFDLIQGRVFRCHVVHQLNDINNKMIIFNFHHTIFDGTSESIFLNDLCKAYISEELTNNVIETPTYIDYVLWEREFDMSNALLYWKNSLVADVQSIKLPYDRHLPTKVRSGRGSSVFVRQLDGEKLLIYARQLKVTPFQLCLAIYYAFLYKLTHTEDLIVCGVVANRSRPELESMIGMFANLIPYRLNIEPQETFRQLVERVQRLCLDILPHTCLPFQTIKQLFHSTIDISTTLDFETLTTTKYSLDNNTHLTSINLPIKSAMFDLSISFKNDITTNTCTCSFDYSLDVFDISTIDILTRRFELLVAQILDNDQQSVYKFNLILDDELQILHHFNPPLLDQPTDCIHWIFALNAQNHPQKIAITMEDQSLSYNETLYYAQQAASHLITQYR